MTLYTIGHSTRSSMELHELLHAHGIEVLADIRTYPFSRRFPHFNGEEMRRWLGDVGIYYVHLPILGGRRTKSLGDASPNGAWKSLSFRNFADYMQTEDFERGMQDLFALVHSHRVAIMCSEAVPWRCHRGLVSDACIARGWEVLHILGPGEPRTHAKTQFARIEGARVTYPDLLAEATR